MSELILTRTGYDEARHLHDAPVNTVGNGLFCCRGFFEEQTRGTAGLGGIYMARVFGRGGYTPWKGVGRELANVPNFFRAEISVNGKPLELGQANLREFCTDLDLQNAVLHRQYTYWEDGEALAQFTFTRFASKAEIHTAGQRIQVKPLKSGLTITVDCRIDADITNLNDLSCEPWPIQPGKRHCVTRRQDADVTVADIPEPDDLHLAFAQKTWGRNAAMERTARAHRYTVRLEPGQEAVIEKLAAIALSPEDGADVEAVVKRRLAALPSYAQALAAHKTALARFWAASDLRIQGSPEDQLAIRYNILQLMQSCPEHTDRYSIGARGLTGEMYEGSIFWDTEIFMLPFFTLTRPRAARRLLEFRKNTLPEARAHAKSNWLAGAMYGWQVNAGGVEQTPQGVGAYYSIHVVADIAYAILDYWHCTGDEDFLLNGGLEILVETARFWAGRADLREDGRYDINAVRGPNEYDVLVNNNLYTNLMARENLLACPRLLERFDQTHPENTAALRERLALDEEEIQSWTAVAEGLVLPYDQTRDLWLEDDAYLRRRPLDMKKAKPTAKRIIDTTIPYEALPLYQVSKQADVLHVMKNLPWHFTPEQVETAFQFYQPRTAFDSSLAYSMFALMAARLGRTQEALRYFRSTARLDLDNVQLNTISGLHFANFGGAWQAAVFGFGGVEVREDGIRVDPHLPEEWQGLTFSLEFRGARLAFSIDQTHIRVELAAPGREEVRIRLAGREFVFTPASPAAEVVLE